MAAKVQFIKGVEEPTIPDVRLTRSRDGSSGVATFTFQNPAVFDASSEVRADSWGGGCLGLWHAVVAGKGHARVTGF